MIFCALVAAGIQPLIANLAMVLPEWQADMDRVQAGFLVTAIASGIVLVASILWLYLL